MLLVTPELVRDRLDWAPRGRAQLVIDLPAYFARVERKRRLIG